jgi:hypothetical protein
MLRLRPTQPRGLLRDHPTRLRPASLLLSSAYIEPGAIMLHRSIYEHITGSSSVDTVRLTLFLLALCVPILLLRAEKGTPKSVSFSPPKPILSPESGTTFDRAASHTRTQSHKDPPLLCRSDSLYNSHGRIIMLPDPSLRSRSVVAQSRAYDVPEKYCRCLVHASMLCRQLYHRHE